ncbi:MAG: arylsulfatase [Pirellulales bacterium]|nr:arylsulfatase [Pirellulales bacterium]
MLRSCLAIVAASLLVSAVLPCAGAAEKPNVVIFLADDLGFSDLGCYGSEIRTPNLDRLAGEGLRFTQFYNTARCWPTRAAILTGYYAQQVRRDGLPGVMRGGQDHRGERPEWARLLPEMLKPLGYRCYHSGKWHIDGGVVAGGFDRSYRIADHKRFFSPQEHYLDDKRLPPVKRGTGYYATTVIADYAVKQLRDHQREHPDEPFFSYVAFTSPHFPLHALPEDIARYRDRYKQGWDVLRQERWQRLQKLGIGRDMLSEVERGIGPGKKAIKPFGPGEINRAVPWEQLTEEQKDFQATKMAIHAAMVDRMDQEIGRVLDQLRQMNAMDNTLIFFLSDNGASCEIMSRGDGHDPKAPPGSADSHLCLGPGWAGASNTPFRYHKKWVHEGGIATPLIVHWPAGITAKNALRHNVGHVVDLAPTILDAAGGQPPTTWKDRPVPPRPGKSLLPALAKDGSVSHEYLWWFHQGNRAIRLGDWKLVSAGSKGPWELYNLAADRNETKNLAEMHPDKVRELNAVWKQHLDEFVELAQDNKPSE